MEIQIIKNLFDRSEYENVLELVKDDKTIEAKFFQINCLLNIGFLDEADQVLQTNINLFERNLYWKVIYSEFSGRILWHKGDLDNAMKIYTKALDLSNDLDDQATFESFENKSSLIGRLIQEIGVTYGNKGNYNQALQFGLKALKIRKKNNDLYGICHSCFNVGHIYHIRGQYNKAMTYYEEARNLAHKHNFLIRLESLYNDISEIFSIKGQNDLAIDLAIKAVNLGEKMSDQNFTIAFAYSNASAISFELGDRENGEIFLEKLRKLSENTTQTRIKDIYLFRNAIHLKNSKRIQQKAEGEKLLREFINKRRIRKELTIIALRHLLEFILMEYRITQEAEVLSEFKIFINDMETIAREQQIFGKLINTLQLKARLDIIDGNYDEALIKLEEASQIALNNEMNDFLENINEEKKGIEKEFKKISLTLQQNESLSKKLSNNEIMDYVVDAIKLVK